ncbi:MAG: UDP-N-acetylmuramate dehydrogenase [Alphaproteobacteria bacterium]
MSLFRIRGTKLIDLLPKTKGSLIESAPLSDLTWFGVGGPAEVMFRPFDENDLINFLKNKPRNIAVTVIGVGSNILIRDGGVPGVVLRLGTPFTKHQINGDTIKCGASALNINIAKEAMKNGIAGLEFLSGIPGTIGGSLKMNAGAFNKEIKDILVSVTIIDSTGKKHELGVDDIGFAYRKCLVPNDWIFSSAVLRGYKENPDIIATKMQEYRKKREETQPIGMRTGGSTFKNPEGLKAWKLIDKAGCRGLRHGGAIISEKHCNFIINTGGATALDIEELGEEVRKRVKAVNFIELEWEIRRIGVKNPKDSSFGGMR